MDTTNAQKRHTANRVANEARHAENAELVASLRLPGRESQHTKRRVGKDGKEFFVTTSKRVRPSKLLRSHARDLARRS